MAPMAWTEWNGIPVDVTRLELLKSNWESIKKAVAKKSAKEYPVYGGPQGMTIIPELFEAYLKKRGVDDWPRTETGKCRTDFKLLEKASKEQYPWLTNLKDAQYILSKMKLS